MPGKTVMSIDGVAVYAGADVITLPSRVESKISRPHHFVKYYGQYLYLMIIVPLDRHNI